MAWAALWTSRELSVPEVLEIHNLYGPNLQYPFVTGAMKVGLGNWWDFEEVSGTRYDAHGSIDLTDNNTVLRALVVYP